MSNGRFVVEKPKQLVPKLKNVKPFGSTILVEMLNGDEVLSTKLYVNKDVSVGAPQAYVLALGPKLNADEVGIKVGDRVMLQGSYVPVPKFDDSSRQRGIVELHGVKAILEEEKEEAALDDEE
jgi:co-chaperonin GroES (HSP10)